MCLNGTQPGYDALRPLPYGRPLRVLAPPMHGQRARRVKRGALSYRCLPSERYHWQRLSRYWPAVACMYMKSLGASALSSGLKIRTNGINLSCFW